MLWLVLAVLGLATGGLVLAVEGLQIFAVWNLVPVALTLLASAVGARQWRLSPSAKLAVAVFCFANLGCVALLHLAWHFDWGGTATGSSTAGLIFVFAPVYCVVVAGVAAVITVAALALTGLWRPGA